MLLVRSATYGPTTVVPSGDQVAKNQGAAHIGVAECLMRQFVFGVEMVITKPWKTFLKI